MSTGRERIGKLFFAVTKSQSIKHSTYIYYSTRKRLKTVTSVARCSSNTTYYLDKNCI